MTQKIAIHKGKEQPRNSLWWKPLLAWQEQMNDTMRQATPSFMSPIFWSAEEGILDTMQKNMNRIYGEVFNTRHMLSPFLMGGRAEPYVDIIEKEKSFIVKAHIPGIDAEDLDVSVSESALIITGEHREEESTEGSRYIHRECQSSFSRTIAMPEDADMDHASATFNRNVLTVEIPRKHAIPEESRKLKIASHEEKGKRAA